MTYLAADRKLAASTQNQALSAILFLYQKVLQIELPKVEFLRAKRPERLPVVLSIDEVRAVLGGMAGTHRLPAELMSGSGLRVLECCRLRVKDLDFGRHQVVVRDGKGGKDRVVPLPRRLQAKLRDRVADARALHSRDLAAGHGRVWRPHADVAKWPGADREFAWQYLFPSSKLSTDSRDGSPRPRTPCRGGTTCTRTPSRRRLRRRSGRAASGSA